MGGEKPRAVLKAIKTDPGKAAELGRRGGMVRAKRHEAGEQQKEGFEKRVQEEAQILREIISDEREEEERRRAEGRSGAGIPADPEDPESGYDPNEHYYHGGEPLKRRRAKKDRDNKLI